jgi:hypothetical protein
VVDELTRVRAAHFKKCFRVGLGEYDNDNNTKDSDPCRRRERKDAVESSKSPFQCDVGQRRGTCQHSVTTTAAEDGDEVEDEDETDASGLRLRCMG